MGKLGKFGILIVLGILALPAFAADFAVLHNGFSILHTRREVVGTVTRLYTGSDRDSFIDVSTDQIDHYEHDATRASTVQEAAPKPAQNLDQVITATSARHRIDPDFITSVIHVESGFNQRAVSPKGAQGLMQLMPQTANQLGVADAFNPGDNVEGGTRYLRELLERYNFNAAKALAAYNAGPQRVEQYRGVPPYAETRAYVARIIRDFNRKKLAEKRAGTTAKPTRLSVLTAVKQAAATVPSK